MKEQEDYMNKKFVGLDLPSVLGMGISGPVLAFLTATLYSAFKSIFNWDAGAYAVIMMALSSALAVFPAAKSEYKTWLKVVVWPVAAVMIFASAWGSSTGLSAGEEAVGVDVKKHVVMAATEWTGDIPENVPRAPMSSIPEIDDADTVNPPLPDAILFRKESSLKGGFFKRMK